ncbi:phasin family protein, partial [Ottowia sp.]|uniref:phasin family protein n=1 Tax=Ottowia sp. TaxID=1898956 RepID=UPI002B84AA1B
AEGSKAFEALVKQGLEWQARTQALAKEKWAEAAERMGAMTAQATGGVGSWDRLGGIFEERVARALASMGMPSASEVAQLQARVEALETALNALQSGAPQPRPARARKR